MLLRHNVQNTHDGGDSYIVICVTFYVSILVFHCDILWHISEYTVLACSLIYYIVFVCKYSRWGLSNSWNYFGKT